ncbi:MAG TPA: glycosyltransferase 87 family protein [Gaiellaceae bacterium]|nr:glycosyltransferase 87 family protein [Gaiellaceae bacterium]
MKRRRLFPSEDAALRAGAAAAVFLSCFAFVHLWFWAHGQISDVGEYKQYGDEIVHGGLVPYRDFAVDYPPGALPAFIVPEIAGAYTTAFELFIAACGLVLIGVVERIRPCAAWFVAVSPLLVGSTIYTRFDLWPALLATAALAALVANRDKLGWGILGVAIAAKAWPLVLVPLALAWSWRRGHRFAPLAGVATLCAIVLPFVALSPHGVWASLDNQASRPPQIESLAASFLTTFGRPTVVDSHGSQNIAGHDWLGAASVVVAALVLLALWCAYARGAQTSARLLRYAAAATCAFVAFDKVLSPQFLIWLVPLVPLVRGRRGLASAALLAVALVLTQVWFPWRYWDYARNFELAGVVLARDLVLVALLGTLTLRKLDA